MLPEASSATSGVPAHTTGRKTLPKLQHQTVSQAFSTAPPLRGNHTQINLDCERIESSEPDNKGVPLPTKPWSCLSHRGHTSLSRGSPIWIARCVCVFLTLGAFAGFGGWRPTYSQCRPLEFAVWRGRSSQDRRENRTPVFFCSQWVKTWRRRDMWILCL